MSLQRALKQLCSLLTVPRNTPLVRSRHFSATGLARGGVDSFGGNRPLRGERARQFLTSDKETIVCVHPVTPVERTNTKPLHPFKPALAQRRGELTAEEAQFVKRLRAEDPALWSIATLARLFNVRRITISKIAPGDAVRQEEVKKEEKLMARMKPYRRSLYLAKRELIRRQKLEQVISERNYKFPVEFKKQLPS